MQVASVLGEVKFTSNRENGQGYRRVQNRRSFRTQ